jgi:ketosteroid isomerase-like protein
MQAPTPAPPNDDVERLRALEATFAAAFNDKDADAAIELYAPGKSLFVYDVVGPPGVYVSSDEYREALKRFFATLGALTFTISDLEVEASGDVGYGRSLQRISGVR